MENSLSIINKYPEGSYNLLIPIQTITDISDIQKPVINVVKISTDLNDREIYEQEKPKAGYTDRDGNKHPSVPAKYAIAKKGLIKLMRASGIRMVESKAVIPSTCQKCAEVNKSIGKAVNCGSCPCKDVKYQSTIEVPQLTGESLTVVANKEIIVDDVTAGMSDRQKAEFLKSRAEMCESKALNRALRTAMQIKGTYLIEEFDKPFVVAYLAPNLDNPEVKAAAIESFYSSSAKLYPGIKHKVVLEDDEDETPKYIEPLKTESLPEPKPEPKFEPKAEPAKSQIVCSECGAPVTGKVADYTISRYKQVLCFDCQRELKSAE